MRESKTSRKPHFRTVQEAMEFFDSHDMGDYWKDIPEADFEVVFRWRRHLVAVDKALMVRVAEIAKTRRVSVVELVNSRLEEKVAGAA